MSSRRIDALDNAHLALVTPLIPVVILAATHAALAAAARHASSARSAGGRPRHRGRRWRCVRPPLNIRSQLFPVDLQTVQNWFSTPLNGC